MSGGIPSFIITSLFQWQLDAFSLFRCFLTLTLAEERKEQNMAVASFVLEKDLRHFWQ